MDKTLAHHNTAKYPLGALLAEGKTKQIYAVKGNPALVLVVSKDDITAGDGAKHDIIPDKGKIATETTCNVFRLLHVHGVTTAFVEQDNCNSFVAKRCRMLPFEIVVRREAHGSYLKRYPWSHKGERLAALLVEVFLKTENQQWGKYRLPCNDPLMVTDVRGTTVNLYHPAEPLSLLKNAPFLTLRASEVFLADETPLLFGNMGQAARRVFEILEAAWAKEGGRLVDFKVEFGLDAEGNLLLADVIDNDSWRVIEDGEYVDKQIYRDGGKLEDVATKYRRVAETTSRFLSV